jgi:hypothetical protein
MKFWLELENMYELSGVTIQASLVGSTGSRGTIQNDL